MVVPELAKGEKKRRSANQRNTVRFVPTATDEVKTATEFRNLCSISVWMHCF